jgi:hypothetical protein
MEGFARQALGSVGLSNRYTATRSRGTVVVFVPFAGATFGSTC